MLEAAESDGELPVPFLLRVMRDRKNPLELRIHAARITAPYLHPRLSAVQVHHHQAKEPALVELQLGDRTDTRIDGELVSRVFHDRNDSSRRLERDAVGAPPVKGAAGPQTVNTRN
jgi:hypothetical protein